MAGKGTIGPGRFRPGLLPLVIRKSAGSLSTDVRDRFQNLLPWCFALVVALSRWPGLFPPNFSVVYALCLCGGMFFPGRLAVTLPLGTLLVSDVCLNLWYQFGKGYDVWDPASLIYMAGNYAGYAVLFLLGRGLRPLVPGGRWRRLPPVVLGSLVGVLLFYGVTNTLAWLRDPAYSKTLAGWWTALTTGSAGWPETWKFLRNSLSSGALFGALFSLTWQAAPSESPQEKGDVAPAVPADAEPEPEEQAA